VLKGAGPQRVLHSQVGITAAMAKCHVLPPHLPAPHTPEASGDRSTAPSRGTHRTVGDSRQERRSDAEQGQIPPARVNRSKHIWAGSRNKPYARLFRLAFRAPASILRALRFPR
jgi:hypothetical protein